MLFCCFIIPYIGYEQGIVWYVKREVRAGNWGDIKTTEEIKKEKEDEEEEEDFNDAFVDIEKDFEDEDKDDETLIAEAKIAADKAEAKKAEAAEKAKKSTHSDEPDTKSDDFSKTETKDQKVNEEL